MEVNVWTYSFEPPGPAFLDSTNTKYNWNEISSIPDLADYPLNHEVLGTIVYFTGPFTNTSEIDVHVEFYNNDTGKFLWGGHQYIPTPASQGAEWWNWYKTKFWIGHCSWEIEGPMNVRAEINLSGWASGSTTLYMNVVDTSPPPPPSYYEEVESYTGSKPPDKIIIGWSDGYRALSVSNDTITGWENVGEWGGKTIIVAYGFSKDYYHILYTNYLAVVNAGSPAPETPTPSIKETINWESSVPDHGIVTHPFYLFSFYGNDTNGTIGGFQINKGAYVIISTPSMSRVDDLIIDNVSQFDCLTIIAENYDGSTISGIYDWKIDKSIM